MPFSLTPDISGFPANFRSILKRPAFLVLILISYSFFVISQAMPRLIISGQGHAAKVNEVLFSSDGTKLISVSDDKNIHIWDTGSGELLRTIRTFSGQGFSGRIYCAALSPDDRFLAIGGYFAENEIRIIDLNRDADVVLLKGHQNVISRVRFSSDGLQLLSAGNDNTIRLWNLKYEAGRISGVPGKIFKGHSAPVYDISWAPDDRKFVSASLDGSLRLWSLTDSEPVLMRMHIEKVYSVSFSGDGKSIASGGSKGDVLIWNADGTYRKKLPSFESPVTSLSYDPLGKLLAVTDRGQLVDPESGIILHRFAWSPGSGSVTAGAVFKDQQAALAGGFEGNIVVYRNPGFEPSYVLKGKGRIPRKLVLKDPMTVGVGYRNEKVSRFFDLAAIKFLWDKPGGSVVEPRRSENGYQLQKLDDYSLSTGFSGSVKNEPLKDGRILSYAILGENRIGVGSDNSLKIYDRKGKFVSELKGQNGEIWDMIPTSDSRYIMAACGDQTISLWNIESGEKLISLFIAENNEWIIWTPQGYYESSAGGEDFLGWQVDKSSSVVSSFYPSTTFQSTFHNPEAVRQTLRLGSFQKASEYIGELNKVPVATAPVPKKELTQAPPDIESAPKIEWFYPEQFEMTVTKPEIIIRARVTSEKEITMLRILVDGRIPAGQRSTTIGGKEFMVEQKIKLNGELTEIRIFARTETSRTLSEPRRIFLNGSARQGTETLQLVDYTLRPNLFFLGIGISKYKNPDYDLNFAEVDAKGISDVFRNPGTMYKETNISILTNEQATRDGIISSVRELKTRVSEKDVVVLFIASHGFIHENNFYVLPHDAVPGNIPATSVRWDQLSADLADLPCKVLLILDACHSGQLGTNFAMRPPDNTEALRTMSSDEYGVVIMSASTGSETALESDAWQHGAFSLSILEGLSQGKADVRKDGIIHLAELDLFVSER
ncbi:MAG: caspase family protein, partial [Cyclobacteriaceae bacterium]